MRWIYLSPHFDDAVLSCGGLICDQTRLGIPVEIWTIFAGDPPPGPLSDFALANHTLWGLPPGPETVALRKDEDEAAAGVVGADPVHFDIPDCIYRRSLSGEYLYTETVMTTPHPADRGLPRHIAAALRSELRKDDRVVCPLALGGHVDHRLARRAAEALRRPLCYYADIPYLINYPEALVPAIAKLKSDFFPVSAAGLEAWLEGVAAYRSQVASLLRDRGDLLDAIRSYWKTREGLLLWKVV
jgi:LmbE family N-acetylglucosaminyl deacetylase